MKTINIAGKDYRFEFSIEASLYNECTESVTGIMVTMAEAQGKEDIKAMVTTIADIPKTALTMFYAGLIEHHGYNGDKTVMGIPEAKSLVKKYLSEHKEDGKGNFYSIMQEMIECMSDDGFFELIGLGKLTRDTAQKTKITKTAKVTDK